VCFSQVNKKKTKEANRLLHHLLIQAGFDDVGRGKIFAKPGGERTRHKVAVI